MTDQDQSIVEIKEDKEEEEEDKLLRVPIASIGEWPHPLYGKVRFTEEDYSQVHDNFKSNKLGYEPFLSFGHLDEEPQSTDSHRKRGRLADLEREGDILWGIYKVRPTVHEKVKNGDYEYASGEYIRNLMDKRTGDNLGCALSRVALTNSPYLPLPKIEALSQNGASEEEVTQVFTMQLPTLERGATQVVEPVLTPPEEEPKPPEEKIPRRPQWVKVFVRPSTPASTTPLTPPLEEKEEAIVSDNSNPNTEEEDKDEIPMTTDTVTLPLVEAPPTESAPAPAPLVTPTVAELVAQMKSEITASMEEALSRQVAARSAELEEIRRVEAEKKDAEIAALRAQLDEVKKDLGSQVEAAQSFSQTVAQAHLRQQQEQLLTKGMPPAFIGRHLALMDSIRKQQQTIKLSQGADQAPLDVPIAQAVEDFVLECLSQGGGVVYGQQGATTTSDTGSNGVFAGLQGIVERNKAKAAQLAQKTAV